MLTTWPTDGNFPKKCLVTDAKLRGFSVERSGLQPWQLAGRLFSLAWPSPDFFVFVFALFKRAPIHVCGDNMINNTNSK